MDIGTIIFGLVVIAVICVLAWVFTSRRKRDDDIPVGPLPPIQIDPNNPGGNGILVPDDPIYKPEVDEPKVDPAVVVEPAPKVEEPKPEPPKVKPKPTPKPKRNQWPPPKRKR